MTCHVRKKFKTSKGLLIVLDRPNARLEIGEPLHADDGTCYTVRGFAYPRGYFPDILSVLVEERSNNRSESENQSD